MLGEVCCNELGVVLPHEHILVDFSKGIVPHPLLPDGRDPTLFSLSMENLGFIRRFPSALMDFWLQDDIIVFCRYAVQENIILDELEKALDEVRLFKLAKGGTICEMSVVGMRRDNHKAADLSKISSATGVHIVLATGFYSESFLPAWVKAMSVRDMADLMRREIREGVEGVKCGMMYIGCSNRLTDVEKRSLQAAAVTYKETGISIAIRPGLSHQSPLQVLDFLSAEGVPPHAISMSHMERTFFSDPESNIARMSDLCQRGCYINHSLFGKECSHYEYSLDVDFPSDAQKIERVKALVSAGCADRLLISHDIVCKHEWSCYGGTGYGHLLEHVLPKFLDRGLEQATLDKIMQHNTRNWLTGSH